MAKIPLEDQVTAMISFIALAKAKGIEGNQDAVEACLRTLGWMRDHPEEMRLAAQIVRDDRVKAVKDAFPGAQVVAARKI
jgi:hypothetical protein